MPVIRAAALRAAATVAREPSECYIIERVICLAASNQLALLAPASVVEKAPSHEEAPTKAKHYFSLFGATWTQFEPELERMFFKPNL